MKIILRVIWKDIYLVMIYVLSIVSMNGQSSFSLEEAVSYGLENHPNKDADQLAIAEAALQVNSYYALGLPKVNSTINYNYFPNLPVNIIPGEFFGMPGKTLEAKFGTNNRMDAGVSLSTMIFDGSFFTGLKAQKAYIKLIEKNQELTEYEIRSNITKAYLLVLLAEENIKVIKNNIKNLQSTIDQTELMLQSGFVEKLDLDRLALSYDNLTYNLNSLERIRELNLNILKYQMNYPLEENILLSQNLDDIVDKIILEKETQNLRIDIQKRPEYAMLEMQEKLQGLNLRAKKNVYYPTIYGIGTYNVLLQRNKLFDEEEPGFSPNSMIGLQVNIPIYSGGNARNEINKVKLRIERLQLEKSEFERAVSMQANNQLKMLENAKEKVEITKRMSALADEIYEVTLIKYKEGVGSSIESTQAERESYSAQQNHMQALYDLVTTKVELDIILGRLEEQKY